MFSNGLLIEVVLLESISPNCPPRGPRIPQTFENGRFIPKMGQEGFSLAAGGGSAPFAGRAIPRPGLALPSLSMGGGFSPGPLGYARAGP